MYCASCVLINSVVDIGATASGAQGVELTSSTDDIFAAKNLNRLSAGGIASDADGVDAVFDARNGRATLQLLLSSVS